MHQLPFVHVDERLSDMVGRQDRVFDSETTIALQEVLARRPVDVLHLQEVPAAGNIATGANRADDMAMLKRFTDAGLAIKAIDVGSLDGQIRRKHLECYLLSCLRVEREVDGARAALAELAKDVESLKA